MNISDRLFSLNDYYSRLSKGYTIASSGKSGNGFSYLKQDSLEISPEAEAKLTELQAILDKTEKKTTGPPLRYYGFSADTVSGPNCATINNRLYEILHENKIRLDEKDVLNFEISPEDGSIVLKEGILDSERAKAIEEALNRDSFLKKIILSPNMRVIVDQETKATAWLFKSQ